jgi:hypothetical protein
MKILGLLIMAALAGLFISLVTSKQLQALTISNMAGVTSNCSSLPGAALSPGPLGRPICEVPLDPCVGRFQNGMAQGDPALYPGSYFPSRYYNTGAFQASCGENPSSCLNCMGK